MTVTIAQVQAKTLRAVIRDLIREANRLEPKRQFLFLENDMHIDDLNAVSAYITAQSNDITAQAKQITDLQGQLTTAQQATATAQANAMTPDAQQALDGLGTLAQQIAAAQAPAPAPAPAPAS